MIAARWSRGSEVATFPNGSTVRPFPPTKDALHSTDGDLVIVDEAWVHAPDRGRELIQAISPIQASRLTPTSAPQLILLSAMGTAASSWWHEWVDAGRAGDPRVAAFIEYGIGDDGDPDDLDAVIAAHPAVGHLIDAEFIRRQHALMSRGEFARAYGNARTASDERFIDRTVWQLAATGDPLPDAPAPVFAAAVAVDRSRTAIVACVGGVAEVIDSRPGVEWAADRMVELIARWSPPAVDVHRVGPSGTLADALTTRGVALVDVSPTDYATACVNLLDQLGGRVRYRRHGNLDAAADAAVPASTGDGGWKWGRRASGGPICELEAMTLAAWLDAHRPAPVRQVRPRVRA